jgi:hypothetical protein
VAANRNAPCSCGSGKKYKKCCALKARKTTLGGWAAMSVIGLMLLAGAVVRRYSLRSAAWESSEEHGHWH